MLFLLLFVPLGFYLFLTNSGLKFGNFLETIATPSQEEESGRDFNPGVFGTYRVEAWEWEVPLRALNSHSRTDTLTPIRIQETLS